MCVLTTVYVVFVCCVIVQDLIVYYVLSAVYVNVPCMCLFCSVFMCVIVLHVVRCCMLGAYIYYLLMCISMFMFML